MKKCGSCVWAVKEDDRVIFCPFARCIIGILPTKAEKK